MRTAFTPTRKPYRFCPGVYKRETGKIYCKQREENARKRAQGKSTKYVDPVISQAWEESSNAHGFKTLLEAKGYALAQGRKRLVVVDPHDKTHNPARHLSNVRAKQFHERMAGLDTETLPTVEKVITQRDTQRKAEEKRLKNYEDRVAKELSKQFTNHYREREGLRGWHHRKIEKKTAELEVHYKLDEQQTRIDGLKLRLNNPGFWDKLASQVFRTDRKMIRRLELLEKNKACAEQRRDELIGALEKERDQEIRRLEQRQTKEQEKLTRRLAKQRPVERCLQQEWSRAGQVRAESHNRDGPSLSR